MTAIRKEVLDELLAGYSKPEDMTGPQGILKQLTAALVERALQAELSVHLGYQKHQAAGRGTGNSRNGSTSKTVRTDKGELPIAVPRDRQGTFEPQILKKHQRQFDGFDAKILALYARGMSVREIQGHLHELYGTEVSPDLISRVTEEVMEEVRAWQSRPLERVYPIIYVDALVVKVREQGTVRNKAVYVALGISVEGKKEVLGMWIEPTEGAKFWLHVMTDLKNRGVQDILITCCDGLKGFPEAIEAVFPKTIVQTCVVHMIRNSLRLVSAQDRKALVDSLKPIYTADTEEAARLALEHLEAKWKKKYPSIAHSWRTNWERIRPFFAFTKEIRKIIYTTNAIESLNFTLRKVLKTRGHFPTDEAVFKVLFLAFAKMEKRWTKALANWQSVRQQLAIHFEGRLPL